jgi:hypothetical protein
MKEREISRSSTRVWQRMIAKENRFDKTREQALV